MIDPTLFSVDIFGLTLAVRWHGVLIVAGVVLGALVTVWGIKLRGGDPEWVWNGLVWVIPAGIAGARLWYVVADILGGSSSYLDNPAAIIGLGQGGLAGVHIYGAILFGGVAALFYARHTRVDIWQLEVCCCGYPSASRTSSGRELLLLCG